jgi:hypothetical protein
MPKSKSPDSGNVKAPKWASIYEIEDGVFTIERGFQTREQARKSTDSDMGLKIVRLSDTVSYQIAK